MAEKQSTSATCLLTGTEYDVAMTEIQRCKQLVGIALEKADDRQAALLSVIRERLEIIDDAVAPARVVAEGTLHG